MIGGGFGGGGAVSSASLDSIFGSTRGQILRREASAWAAYTANTNNSILAGDGTDVTLRTVTSLLDSVIGSTQGMVPIRGAATWGALSVGAANTVISSDGTTFTTSTITSLLDSAFGSTQGSILYRGASNWSVLAPGDNGQVISSQGSGANLRYISVLTNPMTTAGDVIYGGVSGVATRAAGGTGALTMAANVPSWSGQYSCRLYISTNPTTQSLTSGALTAIQFDAEHEDVGGLHSTSSNNTRITFPVAGRYLIGGNVAYTNNGTGERNAIIRLNGTTTLATSTLAPVSASLFIRVHGSIQYLAAANDYVELCAYQDSGGALTMRGGDASQTIFWAVLIAGQ